LVSKAHAVDPEAIRQYFPVAHTIDAILDIYHTLLGVDFTAVTPVDAWAPGVLEYRVTDSATHKLLGITYFDLYPRPGKFEHFANFPILPVRTIGGSHVPIAAIVGNWPQPAPGQPALLSHDDVVTFFHEFGHDMAALLATAPYETLSEGFREDFVEAPSQMLENFAWQPSILERVSSNVQTGAPMPSDLIAKLVASRSTDDAYEMTRLVTLSTIDLAYHSSGPHVDTTAVWNAIAGTMDPLLVYPGTHPQVAFGHLMGGYDAGLYAYPWAKVYAQDLFTAFAANPLDPAVGMRYRVDILAPARTIEPDEEVRAFLGRPMDPSAFYAEFATPSPAP
jgi:Zn-dependent oligopeptidase